VTEQLDKPVAVVTRRDEKAVVEKDLETDSSCSTVSE
jgi:hypothetical protein